MEVFTIGGKFEVKDGQHGWAILKYEGYTMYVNALVISQDTPNYVDYVEVANVISKAIKEAQRFLTAEEVYDLLSEYYGGHKVECKEIELLRVAMKPIEYKGYMVNSKQVSYKEMRGHFLKDNPSIHVCGYEGMQVLIQLESGGAVKKRCINHSNKGLYINVNSKRVYIDYIVK